MRVSVALSGLLDVLRRRLDDPWFQRNTKQMRKEYSSGIYVDIVKQAAARADSEEAKTYGVFAGLRRRQLRARRASASKAARARWLKVQRTVPAAVEEGRAWWDKPHHEKTHGFFSWETPMETLEDLAESGNKFLDAVKAAPGRAKAKIIAARDGLGEAMREPRRRAQAIAAGVVIIALGARARKAERRARLWRRCGRRLTGRGRCDQKAEVAGAHKEAERAAQRRHGARHRTPGSCRRRSRALGAASEEAVDQGMGDAPEEEGEAPGSSPPQLLHRHPHRLSTQTPLPSPRPARRRPPRLRRKLPILAMTRGK